MADKKIPYHRKPEELSVDEWQAGLRKQFAADQKFKFTNIGDHPVYSDFEVFNPNSGNTYKVCIRDGQESYNFCSCPDFKINTLGTCKHIEYMLHYFSSYKKYQKHLLRAPHPNISSLSIVYGQERRIRLEKAAHISKIDHEDDYFDQFGYLKPGKLESLGAFIEASLKKDDQFTIYPDVQEYIEHDKKTRLYREKANELFSKGINSDIFNGLIRANLYDYQREGVMSLVKQGRMLLADEMGLGKTIQSIAATEIFARNFGIKKVLIICPTSLKYQWKREIEKFSDNKATVVEGLIHKRKDLYLTNTFYKIISYGACRNDLVFINSFAPDLVIIDEAQKIKNWKTQTAQSVKKINSEFAIVLTGTPLENKIDELHSIIEFIDQYKLGPLFRFLHHHQILDENGKLKGYKNLRGINKTLSDILLRRTKKEIIDQLPGRVDKNYFVELTKEQEKDHNDYYETVRRLVNKWIAKGILSESDRERLLLSLNCMRMVCDSTYILNQKTNHGNKISEITELISELLQNEDNKIVIFSQWKRMFELLIKELKKLNIPFVYLNGDISAQQRKEIIELFQENSEIKIFLSTDAGGVGVNLQSANVLINVDLPWNPAVLEQRIGRIYRLGQKKHVDIYNFIARKSIEHRILYLLDFKRSVFSGALDEEGQDSVMLEGFLESVKALTDVNLEEEDTEHSVDDGFSRVRSKPSDFDAEEHNKEIIDGHVGEKTSTDILKDSIPEKSTFSKHQNQTKRQKNVLAGLAGKVKKFFSRFMKK